MSRGPHVSDHALVRFLARAGGLDVEGVRAHLAASLQRAARAAMSLDCSDYVIRADGLVYIVAEGRVVTIFEDNGAPVVSRGAPRQT